VLIPRKGYLQIGWFGAKGTDPELRARGIEAFRRDLVELAPELSEAAEALTCMDDIKQLDIRLNRLKKWHVDGLLCIGDAAHAMSPIGGVGINMAVQDAVAAATLLRQPLLRREVTDRALDAVRRRRELPVRVTQALQRLLHKRLLGPVLAGQAASPPKLLLAALTYIPRLSAVGAKLLGVGVRPERAPAYARHTAISQ
jgi:2-polyprenyl-6-methoxyphenol hydroxylase-like FAD-dependent oxidoreductase